MIAQGAMAFNSRCLPSGDPYGVPQIVVTLNLFYDYAEKAGITGRSIHSLRHSIAVHLLEAGRGIEYVADHLGHKNIQNTKVYAQITNPYREQVFRDLEQNPKIVRLS